MVQATQTEDNRGLQRGFFSEQGAFFKLRDAMLQRYMLRPGVRLSVGPSVTRSYCVDINK